MVSRPKHPGGRPPRFKAKEEMQEKIDAYFEECMGKVLTDEEGNIVRDRQGRAVIVGSHPPTVTGLALALGFASRQALLNYQAKREFDDTITRAKSRVERYTEERLFDRDGVNGAKFSLMNNFNGWSDRQEVNVSGGLDAEKSKLDDLIRQMGGEGQ